MLECDLAAASAILGFLLLLSCCSLIQIF